VDLDGVVDVVLEGLVAADALLALHPLHRAGVTAPREVVEVTPRGVAQAPHQRRQRGVGDVGDGTQAQPHEGLLGALPHPPQGADGQLLHERHDLVAGHDDHAVGLGEAGGDLRHELRRRDADRAGDALLVVDGVADVLSDGRWWAHPSHRTRDVEERLVERERLHHRGHRAKGLHDARGDRAVERVIRRQDGGLWAQPPGPRHRHRRGDPEAARLVGGREHHPAVAAADDDGCADETGV